MTRYSVAFGSRQIDFRLTYSNRKTLGIAVTPEMQVLVTAPLHADLDRIKAKVKKRAPWILKQERYFLTFQPRTPPLKYVSGEGHLFMGRTYKLMIKIDKKEGVDYKGRVLEVRAKRKSRVQKVLTEWYRLQAHLKFPEIAAPWIEKFKRYDVRPSGMHIKSMSKRWGSCTIRGRIILNPELIRAPKRCIEYVIVHELCHLVHRGHTREFFRLQGRVMRAWVPVKEQLEAIMASDY